MIGKLNLHGYAYIKVLAMGGFYLHVYSMYIYSRDEIFGEFVIQSLDRFMIIFKEYLPKNVELPPNVQVDILRIYFERDCSFSFFFFLEVVKYTYQIHMYDIVRSILETMVSYFRDFNYGILVKFEDGYELYVSEDGEDASVFFFNHILEYEEFKKTQEVERVYYEIW